jgi:hypothetical protein
MSRRTSPLAPLAGALAATAVITATSPAHAQDACGTWTMVPVSSPSIAADTRFHGVHAIAPDDAWAVGHYQVPVGGSVDEHYTLTQHWDGAEWTTIPSPSPGLDFDGGIDCYLEAVDAIAPDDVWAVGHWKTQNVAGHVGQQPLTLHWDGTEWEFVLAPFSKPESSGAFLFDVEMIASDDVWVGGLWPYPYKGAGGPAALMFHWDGSEWTPHDTPYITGDGHRIRAISALASDDVYAVGEYDSTFDTSYVIHWDGTEWSLVDGVPSPGTFNYLRDVAALAPDDIWIAGEQWTTEGSYQPLMIHFDGTSWTVVPSPGGGTALAAIASDDIWSSDTWTTGGAIAHWDGTAWTATDTVQGGGGATLLDLAVVGACEVWGVGRRPDGASFLPLVERLESTQTPGDVTGDQIVNMLDLLEVLASWGACAGCPADLNGDAVVDLADLLLVLSNWG